MANLIQLLRRHRLSTTPKLSLINHNSQFQTLTPFIFTQSIDSRLKSLLPSLPKPELEKTEVKYDFIYPSFSYGLAVNPVFQKVVVNEEVDESEEGVEGMWMDSTKKKRKRKMNKHKYKKLMKRTRNTN